MVNKWTTEITEHEDNCINNSTMVKLGWWQWIESEDIVRSLWTRDNADREEEENR
jgi:hypothetical protein